MLVDHVEYSLQVLGCSRSFTARYFFDNASTAKSTTGLSCFIFHALVRFGIAKLLFTFRWTTADAFADRIRAFTLKQENVHQEGFNAEVHVRFAYGRHASIRQQVR